tara:strand:+ start:548 stop:1102 length:555 start_codon:yes stop_codon:yes gene_type:complete
MACPLFDDNIPLTMLKIARERFYNDFNSSSSITSPIYLSDLSRLAGGNSSGSGVNYPAVNLLNTQSGNFFRNRRPDGNDPLKMGEFFGYDQDLQRRQFRFAYHATSSSTACATALQATIYWHDGSNTLPVSGDFIYTSETGSTKAPAGFYRIFDPSTGIAEGTVAEVLGGGGGFSGSVAGVENC